MLIINLLALLLLKSTKVAHQIQEQSHSQSKKIEQIKLKLSAVSQIELEAFANTVCEADVSISYTFPHFCVSIFLHYIDRRNYKLLHSSI
jgi:hypothetical protein